MTTQDMIVYIIDRYEGGEIFTNKPFDRGGATKYGITQRTLQYYRQKKTGNPSLVVTVDDVRTMSNAEATDCAYVVFAGESKIALIPEPGIRFAVLDYGFHSGFHTAIADLQRSVGTEPDGVLGDLTFAALAKFTEPGIVLDLCTQRAELLQKLILRDPRQRDHMLGWWTRVTEVQRKAVRL